jgi:hypothetical protein
MKAAVLETHKEIAIGDIEHKLDALMKAKGITFDQVTPPVKNPNYRTLQALQRIDAKLALVLKADHVTDEPAETAVIVEPEVGEPIPGEKQEAQALEPEEVQPAVKPDRKTKTK